MSRSHPIESPATATAGPVPGARLPDPLETPTLSVTQAGEILGLCKQSAYSAAQRGEIPTLRIGRRIIVPTARLLRMLGADQGAAAS